MKKILLMGNPNVGKSAIFTRLTGVKVIASNYPGTTVEFTRGYMKLGEEKTEIIDVPGTYTLEPTCKAEEVAVEMLKEGDIAVNVLDSTNLERNLGLTPQLLRTGIPMVAVLNFWDETKHKGIDIDIKKLEGILGVPVVTTNAVTGEGIKNLVDKLSEAREGNYKYEDEKKWEEIGKLVARVQFLHHRHHRFREFLADACINPITGIPIVIGIFYISFMALRFIGEGIITSLTEPLFEKIWGPLMLRLSGFLGMKGFIHDVLIGHLINGKIDFMQSFGLLTTGLYVEFAAILPYIFAFYLILGILEDIGYLPRIGVLLDRVMHVVGLHGMGFIPMLLGFGCKVPGVLACRTMETKKEKFIAATLMCMTIPCASQTAMIAVLLGRHGPKGLFIVFGTLAFIWITAGALMSKFVPGECPEMFSEMPPYRVPYISAILKKLWMRILNFFQEAFPFVLLGILAVNLLYSLKILEMIGSAAGNFMTKVFGLPAQAIGAVLVGFLRKDVAVGMLIPLNLSLKQLIIACVLLTITFPCAATFSILLKELGIKDMAKSTLIMIATAFIIGIALNLML